MNATAPSLEGDGMASYVLVPFLFIAVVGITAAGVAFMTRKRRIDRLRHQLLPIYTYDPSEEDPEAEQGVLWRDEDTQVVQSWVKLYQHRRPLLVKNMNA